MPEPSTALTEHESLRARQTARVLRQQVAGLAVAGLAVLVFSAWRAGWGNVFPPGWWRW